jgi:hypothetical protein
LIARMRRYCPVPLAQQGQNIRFSSIRPCRSVSGIVVFPQMYHAKLSETGFFACTLFAALFDFESDAQLYLTIP